MVFPGRFQRVPSVRRSCAGGGNVVSSYKFCPEHLRSSSPNSPRIQAGVILLILLVLPHRRRITYRFNSSSLAILVSTQPSLTDSFVPAVLFCRWCRYVITIAFLLVFMTWFYATSA